MTYSAVAKSVCLSLALCGGAGWSSAGMEGQRAVPGAIFDPRFMGMHTLSPARHWPSVPFGSVRPAGTTWGTLEEKRGIFDWHSLDTWVAASNSHQVALDYVFMNTPQWASTRPDEHCGRPTAGCAAPPNDQDWVEFVTTLVTRYKGRIASYEMWNEPNAIGYFSGSAAEMAHMVALASPIIRSIDPRAIIVSPAPSSTGWPTPYDKWLDQFLSAGGGQYVDAIVWHAYAGTDKKASSPPEDVVNQIRKVRQVLEKHHLGALPLWDTEGGWGSDMQLSDEKEQAAYLTRWYLIQFSYGIARAFWYQWDNPTWGTLWREASGSNLAALAYAQTYNWLEGATGAEQCAPVSGSIWTCPLTKGGRSYLAVWSTAGPATFNSAASYSSYTDLAGNRSAIANHAVLVDFSPILLQADGLPVNKTVH